MRVRAAATVLLVACLLLAGCSGTTGTESTTAPITSSAATDAETPPPPTTTDPATTATGDLPPGISASGVENVTALKRAHVASLRDGGYRERTVVTATFADRPDGEPGRIALSYALDADGEHDRSRTVQTGPMTANRYVATWGNGTVRYRNRTVLSARGSSTTFSRTAIDGPRAFATLPGQYVTLGDYEVASKNDGRVVLRATAASENASDELHGSIETYEGRLVVAPDGRVLDANVTVVQNRSGRTIRQAVDFELQETDDVTVERPPWLDAATEEGIALDADLVDGSYVKLTNVGGASVEAGTLVQLRSDEPNASEPFGQLSEPLEPGEQVYLYAPPGENGLRISRSKPDVDARALSTGWSVSVDGRTLHLTVRIDDEG